MNRRTACMLTTSFGGSSRIMVVYLWKVTTGRLVRTFARNSFAGFGGMGISEGRTVGDPDQGDSAMITRRSMLVVLILAFVLLSLAPTKSAAQRSELEIFSYEMGLSQEFLEEFENGTQYLNIGSAQSRNIIRSLNWLLRELKPGSGSDYQRLRAMAPDAELFIQQLIGLAGQGNVEAAVKQVLRKMHDEGPAVRRSMAQAFRIPERLGLFYDKTSDIRSEIAILSYETALSEEFLEEFENGAQELNIGQSQNIIRSLNSLLRELKPGSGTDYQRLRAMAPDAELFIQQLIGLAGQGNVEAAVKQVLRKMHDEGPAVRRSMAQAFRIPERLGLFYDKTSDIRSEIAILSYETTLSEEFLEEFDQVTENLNIQSARSLNMITTLSGKIRDLRSREGTALNAQLSKIAGGEEFARQLVKLVQAEKVEAAVDQVLRKMHDGEIGVRHSLAQAFGIPDRLGLLYDELEALRKGTGDKN